MSPDGSRLLTFHDDDRLVPWVLKANAFLGSFGFHLGMPSSSPWSGLDPVHPRAAGSAAKIWDVPSGRLLASVPGADVPGFGPTFSPDGQRVLITRKGSTGLWDTSTGKLVATLDVPQVMPQFTQAFSPDGAWLATSSIDAIEVRDAATLKLLVRLPSPGGWTPRSGGLQDHKAEPLPSPSGLESVLDNFNRTPLLMVFSPDGTRLTSTYRQQPLRLWDLSTETRSAEEVARLVHCHAPWRLEDGRLVLAEPDASACR